VTSELVGTGRTANVYALDDGRVLKLFFEEVTARSVAREAENTRLADEGGAPAPAVYGTRTEDGRVGLVLDRLDGPTMLDELKRRPWRASGVGRRLAEVHAGIHDCAGTGLPDQRERLHDALDRAALPTDRQRAVRATLDDLPRETALCHGDCHPDNVVLTPRPVVVDWLDATCGHPLADVARTTLLLRVAGVEAGLRGTPDRLLRRALASGYRRRYAALTGRTLDDRWLLVVAAARLAESVPGERERLLALVDESVSRSTDER